MLKIAFHDNALSERGTTISVYDYAYYNKHYLGNESIILYDATSPETDKTVVEKFKKEFVVRSYLSWKHEANEILKEENCNILYMQKSGDWDGKVASPNVCKTIIHCVFNTNYEHGDIYGKVSSCFGSHSSSKGVLYPVVNLMVNIPVQENANMRKELGIPNDALVFGRHGGYHEFNIQFVLRCIDDFSRKNPNIYFLFVNTNQFCESRSNIIHLDKIVDLNEKVRFINTCDAMIHARAMGETFGLAVAEFSTLNKPVITYGNEGVSKYEGYDRCHLDILKDKCFIYNDYGSLLVAFNRVMLNKTIIKDCDWNAYKNHTPQKIMDEFNEKFIEPLKNEILTKLFIDTVVY